MSRRKKPTFILKIDPNLVHTKYDFDLINHRLRNLRRFEVTNKNILTKYFVHNFVFTTYIYTH